MDDCLESYQDDEDEEILVILASYTVVEPEAVMVEVVAAAVASATVLGVLANMGLAYVAIELKILFVERLVG